MTFFMLVLLALGLSMDAFAVSVVNSMCRAGMTRRTAVFTSAMFGIFQGAMPLLGFAVGGAFANAIGSVDHWIAFALLAFIGGKMLWECIRAWRDPAQCPVNQTLTLGAILTQSVATSIDALAVGISLAALNVNIWAAAALIAGITFVCCLLGHFLGKKCGGLLGKVAQLAGGLILVGIGVKILVEHLMG